MVEPVVTWQRVAASRLGLTTAWPIVTASLAVALVLGPALTSLAAAWIGRRLSASTAPLRTVVCRFALACVPLGLSMWAAHFLFHLITGAGALRPVVQRAAADLGGVILGTPAWAAASTASPDWLPGFELLLLGALTHDIGKGAPGDHSDVGAVRARELATRIGLDDHAVDLAEWLVQHHLLLADTATRRDLAAEETIVRFGRMVQDTERLDLLYVLTIADSRATGASAWSTAKAALCRQLFVETDALLEGAERGAAVLPSILAAIGKTPLVRVRLPDVPAGVELWGKCEWFNPGAP